MLLYMDSLERLPSLQDILMAQVMGCSRACGTVWGLNLLCNKVAASLRRCFFPEAWEEFQLKPCDECWAHRGQKCLLIFVSTPLS